MLHSASRSQSRGQVRKTGIHCSKHLSAWDGLSHMSICRPALYEISARLSNQCLVASTPGKVKPALPPKKLLNLLWEFFFPDAAAAAGGGAARLACKAFWKYNVARPGLCMRKWMHPMLLKKTAAHASSCAG